jgi:hypothetical protein
MGYFITFQNGQFTEQSGTALLTYDKVFDALLNGVTYSVDVLGSQNVAYEGFPQFGLPVYTFTATESGRFVLDPSLFSSFVDVNNPCNRFHIPASGVCVTGDPLLSISGLTVESDNLQINLGRPGAITRSERYTLTYTYNPFGAVPEPGTWLMMLLGFVGIGMALRRRRKEIATVQASDLTSCWQAEVSNGKRFIAP